MRGADIAHLVTYHAGFGRRVNGGSTVLGREMAMIESGCASFTVMEGQYLGRLYRLCVGLANPRNRVRTF
jgi:hypothetical protein